MYAIHEAFTGLIVTGRSMDKHSGEWWCGKGWTPCSDQAIVFDSEEEAELHADEHCNREWVIVEMD